MNDLDYRYNLARFLELLKKNQELEKKNRSFKNTFYAEYKEMLFYQIFYIGHQRYLLDNIIDLIQFEFFEFYSNDLALTNSLLSDFEQLAKFKLTREKSNIKK